MASVVISGSFRKHYEGIKEKIGEFEKVGVNVLSPRYSNIKSNKKDFVILESDKNASPKELEQMHLDAISKADALYVYDPDGYIGISATMELGWALALGKPIYMKEPPKDIVLGNFAFKAATPLQIKSELSKNRSSPIDTINRHSSLQSLQDYMKKVVAERGFEKETSGDILLLMVEEVGELAKALRKQMGIKVDKKKKEQYLVEQEMADVLIYLLDLANACKIDLFKAFLDKERINSKRIWVKG